MDKLDIRKRLELYEEEDLPYHSVMPLIINYNQSFGTDTWIKHYVRRNSNKWQTWDRRHK